VFDAFESAVDGHPERTFLATRTKRLTYREFNERVEPSIALWAAVGV
jgi:hypothetical protein